MSRTNGLRRAALVLATLLLVPTAASCGHRDVPGPQRLRVQVLDRIPHDPAAFTEGLTLVDGLGGTLYESTGLAGHSSVRTLDPRTGAVRHRVDVDAVFGEGIAVTSERLFQLTWQDHMVIERDPVTLRERRRFPLAAAAEGWGACFDGARILTSDGTARLTVRDPDTFAPRGQIDVHDAAGAVNGLNELDCAGDGPVWANVFPTDRLVRIDVGSGLVTGEADLGDLHRQAGLDDPDAVPNGIAVIPHTDTALVTGKRWPQILLVRLSPEQP
ncbi:glutaminyl-peptide cyclotransferase [Actinokineospora enzanensis]|uniref:glutaminyl-peptide cyclotransferase n=1 Tax=Actinokineospora enzanensis TaxID=155975 RepID=UPI00037B8010|nr:glutaminyl-peptide cyclotransferase [Actinokineospora enzanensis]